MKGKEEIVEDVEDIEGNPEDDGATLPEEDNPATETPLKVKVDGVGDLTPEEIKEALDAKQKLADYEKQRSSWEASQHKKGEELNTKMRKLDELTEQLVSKQAELERRFQEPRRERIDLNSIEDPDQRRAVEIQQLREDIADLRGAISNTSGELQKERDQKALHAKAVYWQGELDTALENVSEGLSDREMKFIKKTTTGILNETTADKWTPELFVDAAKAARRELDEVKREDREGYAKAAQTRQKDNRTVTSGTTPSNKPKTRDQFATQEEWLEYRMKQDGG